VASAFDPAKLRRRRRLCLAGLALCALMAMGSLLSFWSAPAYMGAKRQVLFIGGGLLIQGAPAPIDMGFRMIDANIPDRGVLARVIGWFKFPQRMSGGSLFIPFGLLTVIPAIVFILLDVYWSVRPKGRMCPKCGYDLCGADHTVCPECGTPPAPETLIEA
jgi:hypothetical protein